MRVNLANTGHSIVIKWGNWEIYLILRNFLIIFISRLFRPNGYKLSFSKYLTRTQQFLYISIEIYRICLFKLSLYILI